MENSEALDVEIDLSFSGHLLASDSFKGSEIIGNESVFYEKFLLDDLDNYWDELNDRLTVSRMVSDSVIKGMVRAVVDESAEKIAVKDEEISILNQKFQSCDSCSPPYANLELNFSEDVERLRLAADEQLRNIKDDIHFVRYSNPNVRLNSSSLDVGLCSILPHSRNDEKLSEKLQETNEGVDSLGKIVDELFKEINTMLQSVKSYVLQQKWEHEYEREISALVIQSSVRGLKDEFAEKLNEQRSMIDTLNINWKRRLSQLSTMREELDAIFRSLSSSDSGPLLSHNSLDSSEELNALKWKDQFSQKLLANHHFTCNTEENGISPLNQSGDCELMLEVADSSQLKHLSRDELVAYYKTEMIKMRRQHESDLHSKTEELFRLKREFLREKGSSLFKKDREFELLKKRIPEVIGKLDDILLEKEKLPVVEIDHEEICSLKGRVDTLLSENQHFRGQLEQQREEIENLSAKISDAAGQMSQHSSAEAELLLQIEKLNEDLLDVNAESSIRDELHVVILNEIVRANNCSMEESEISARMVQDIYTTVVRGFIADGMSTVNSTILNYFSEKSSLQVLLNQKEKALCIEIDENGKLKQTVTSLSSQIKEKENYASETGSSLIQQKEKFDQLEQEMKTLREQVVKQEALIASNKIESYSAKRILDEALQRIRETEIEIKELNGKLAIALNALKEAEEQNSTLHGIIEDKEKELLSCIEKEKEDAKEMESIVASLTGLSKAFTDLENKLSKNIGRNETRLKRLHRQWRPLLQQTILLTKRAILYKQMLEISSSNLQKAEAEVDLLGDEVDALLSLLGKIYIALDHYSPVLQHYPGVMEILKSVQRELEGETTRSV